ncbi:CHASE domain-containing protein [Thalassospira sp. MA62]|nr:CHASE domain-containing protein [Thalassospira sp. MA62]
MQLPRIHAVRLLIIFVAYTVTGATAMAIPHYETARWLVWLPTGIAIATLTGWGWRYFPAVLAGSLFNSLLIGISADVAALVACSTALFSALAAQIIRHFSGPNPLTNARDLLIFFLVAIILAPALVSFVGIGAIIYIGGNVSWTFLGAWQNWTLSTMAGTLVAAPLILSMIARTWSSYSRARYLELGFIAVVALVISSVIQATPLISRPEYLFIFVSLPLVILAAIRFGMFGASLINALVILDILVFASREVSGFSGDNYQYAQQVIYAYVIGVTFVTIILAAGLEKISYVTTRALDGKISQDIHRLRRTLAVLVAVMGFGISGTAGWYVYQQLSEAEHSQTEQYRRTFEASLREELGRATDSLVAVRTLFDVHGNVSYNTFDAMIAPWVNRRPGVAALAWIPHVDRRSRTLVEENAHLRGVDNFEIRDLENGNMVRAEERDSYFTTFYIFPRSGNERWIGFDISNDPQRNRALQVALATGNVSLTEPLPVLSDDTSSVNALAMLSVDGRRPGGNPLGVAVGVLRMTDMITRAARVARLPSDYELMIADLDVDNAGSLIYSNRPELDGLAHIANEKAERFNPNVSVFTFGFRDWTIVLHPMQPPFAALMYWQPWAIFVFGAMVSILLMVYLHSLTKTERQIVNLIALRTRELEDARAEAEQAMNQAQRADQAKSEFIAHMSHEFRSPMTSILGYTQLATDTLGNHPAADTLRSYLGTIRSAGRHVLSLIGDILDISKIEAGKLILEEVPINLHGICEEVSSMMLVPARAQHNVIHLDIDPDMPRWVVGDPVRIKQVITNLVSNAIKFTKNGTIHIEAKPLTINDDMLSFRIEVRDDGIGIPPAKLETIFEAFTQVDSSTSRRYGGTGLGLSICQRMIQAMGGTIKVDSAEGLGSRFWFELTLPRSDEAAAAGLYARERDDHDDMSSPAPRIIGWNLLLVEDIEINRILAQKLLEQQGHTITTARDGKEALDILHAQDFDGVLMDVHMPVIDGIEATRQVRQFDDPVKATVPILALTADISNDNLATFRDAGFDAHCTKPLDIAAINAELSKLENRMLSERRDALLDAGE